MKWSKLQDHPWLASLLIALALTIAIVLLIGYVILLSCIYVTNIYLFIALIAFPLLILYIRCTWFY